VLSVFHERHLVRRFERWMKVIGASDRLDSLAEGIGDGEEIPGERPHVEFGAKRGTSCLLTSSSR